MLDLQVGDTVWYWPSAFDVAHRDPTAVQGVPLPAKATAVFRHNCHLRVNERFDVQFACPVLKEFDGGPAGHRAAGTCFDKELIA